MADRAVDTPSACAGCGLKTWDAPDLEPGDYVCTCDDVERCPRCGERLYSPAETETHNRTVHNFGPVGTVFAEAEPETRRPL